MRLLAHVASMRVHDERDASQAGGEKGDRPARQYEVALHTGERAGRSGSLPEQAEVAQPRRAVVPIRRNHRDIAQSLESSRHEGSRRGTIRGRVSGGDDEQAHDQRR